MNMPLSARKLVKHFGGFKATDEVSLEVREGELHAVIGPNGAGKTTLVNQLSGELFSDSGEITFYGQLIQRMPIYERARLGLLRSYQITSLFDEFTVLENVALAAMGTQQAAFRFFKPLSKYAQFIDRAREMLRTTGLSHRLESFVQELGYGERRQLELTLGLAAKPKVLLLDEPMAGMSAQESYAVIELLKQLKGQFSILLVEHDMNAVFALADRITVLVYGKVLCTGTPEEIRNNAQVREVYLGDEVF